MSQLKKRADQMKEHINDIGKLEELYFLVAYDIGIYNDLYVEYLPVVRKKKTELKEGSIASQDREFELTDEYQLMKEYKYTIKGLEKIMAGIRMRSESLKANLRGDY